ncbi:MAG TPA: glycosyltransferase family 87 protein [Candidatus Dormibacteraeota bacterium]|nr:glycosyltransferase family 87 protein [Candidatus Dormibacteraeota bacterium]
MTPQEAGPAWVSSLSACLTQRRIRAHALILALCLWGVCAVDYATPGLFDRAGNIKFQDFLQFPISARLIAQGRARELYDDQVLATQIREIAGRVTRVRLQYFYGPQVALPFVPLVGLPFLAQAWIWVTCSLLMYAACVYLLWKSSPRLVPYPGLVTLCAIAYPPLFHFFVRGQLSAVPLVCFTAAYVSFAARREWLAGVALGFLLFKPQFLVAIPLVLLLARAWKIFSGLALSAGAQLAFTAISFGPAVMRAYFHMLLRSASQPSSTELALSPIQMHSLRAFWTLLIPWPPGVLMLYLLSAFAVIAIAAVVWKSSSPLALRFSALILAAVLVNPHLYIYDLLAVVPALLLLADWAASDAQHRSTPALPVLLYLAFLLPLFGPLSRWTHLQLSVPVFVALLWTMRQMTVSEMTPRS